MNLHAEIPFNALHWLSEEPQFRRLEVLFIGEPFEGEPDRPAWQARVWSQKADGRPRKEPGVGRASSLYWAVLRAMDAYFETPRNPDT